MSQAMPPNVRSHLMRENPMERLFRAVRTFSNTLNVIGAGLLTFMMLLTVVDVILRYLGRPITGTFELTAFTGALVAGLALAKSSLDGAHVNVDIVIEAVSARRRKILLVFNRLLGIGVFGLLTWALFLKGNDLYSTGQVSLTLYVPYYPVAYVLSLCCLGESFVLLSDMFKTLLGEKDE